MTSHIQDLDNIAGMREALACAIDQNTVGRIALVTFNLSGFRGINIDHGWDVGDRVLDEVTQRVLGVLRKDDRLFHIGNDEFAALLPGLKSAQLAELAAARIINVITTSIRVGARTISVGANAGLAVYPDAVSSGDEMIRACDAALNKARRTSSRFCIFDQSLKVQGQLSANLTGMLKSALDDNGLHMHYQPQVDLHRGVLSGCEALIRWQDPQRGWISPEIFIPAAEKSELIESLTCWSINVALREWFQYCSRCSQASTLSVNLSARMLHSFELVDLVRCATNIWGVEPGSLILEVTESAMMSDPVAALDTLMALNELGVSLSIDDFGTGYSSLAYLKELPVSELKIDKGFVQSMASDSQNRKIVQAVIDLAHNLDLKVVAEGIENQHTLDMLASMGCDVAQGFYIGQPMAFEDLSAWADNSRWQRPSLAKTSNA